MDRLSNDDVRRLLRLFQPFSPAPATACKGTTAIAAAASATATCEVLIERLAGYDDLNFKITTPESAQSYVLKIHNAADSASGLEVFEAQNALMQHIAAIGTIPSNQPIPLTSDGGHLAAIRLVSPQNGHDQEAALQLQLQPLHGDAPAAASQQQAGEEQQPGRQPPVVGGSAASGQLHIVRLLTFVPGALLGVKHQSRQLQQALGTFISRLVRAMEGFDHPVLHNHNHDWSLECAAATIARKLPRVDCFSDGQRQLIHDAVERLEGALHQAAGGLPQQVCHTDANESNVLVNEDRTQVIGLLDWGDATRCWRAVEVAVAATYAVLLAAMELPADGDQEAPQDGKDGSKDAPLQAAANVMAGYLAAGGPLTPGERQLLPALIGARIALSLTNGAFAALANPGNSAYLLQTQLPGWKVLGMLQARGCDELAELLVPQSSVSCRAAAGGQRPHRQAWS